MSVAERALSKSRRPIGRWRIEIMNGKHTWYVFLWPTKERLRVVVKDKDAVGFHHPRPYWINRETGEKMAPRCMGHIHIALDHYSHGIVMHELLHAMMHGLDVLGPTLEEMANDMSVEEDIVHEWSKAFQELYRNIWERDQELGVR